MEGDGHAMGPCDAGALLHRSTHGTRARQSWPLCSAPSLASSWWPETACPSRAGSRQRAGQLVHSGCPFCFIGTCVCFSLQAPKTHNGFSMPAHLSHQNRSADCSGPPGAGRRAGAEHGWGLNFNMAMVLPVTWSLSLGATWRRAQAGASRSGPPGLVTRREMVAAP